MVNEAGVPPARMLAAGFTVMLNSLAPERRTVGEPEMERVAWPEFETASARSWNDPVWVMVPKERLTASNTVPVEDHTPGSQMPITGLAVVLLNVAVPLMPYN